MPKKFDDMVQAVKKTLKKQNPDMNDKELSSKAYAMATAQWKKSHGGKLPSKEVAQDWHVLEYFVPIQESEDIKESGDFVIRGVAINETTTMNNVKYVAEELSKAAHTFRNVPILLDHENKVKNIVGRTTENVIFNDSMRRIDFEGKIMDKDIKEMIKDGRIGSVSIGAKVSDLVEEEDGSMKAIGIHGLEISLVAVPGDSHANLAQALEHSFYLKEMAMNSVESELEKDDLVVNDKIKMENDKMAENEEEKPIESSETSETSENDDDSENEDTSTESETEEKVKNVSTESTATNVNIKVDTSEIADMKKQISELKELLVEKKKIQEKKMKEDKTKGIVTEDSEKSLQNLNNMILERSQKGFALYRDYTKEDLGATKLKRLVRV